MMKARHKFHAPIKTFIEFKKYMGADEVSRIFAELNREDCVIIKQVNIPYNLHAPMDYQINDTDNLLKGHPLFDPDFTYEFREITVKPLVSQTASPGTSR
jgi:hypothetical protein